jgi:lipopolysaccharide transport system ATP-binding protein
MSSSDIAISVRDLSKSYTLAHNAVRHTTLGEALVHRLKNPLQRAEKETFWALKDVSFDINKGDVVGIIGRNGAGKSTLLKILSRITRPTTGEIRLYGRVGSLLEVGTGFHPELTGRENIYLNGAILGMRKSEIDRQFDAIVDFAEVEQFLDTPVKRYSSGMYVRLAFAVAAHLNPEILVVDEVLAVGDAEFQKKCLGKMKDVANSGRTVLFVSHNMAAVRSLCSRAVLLHRGQVMCNDEVDRCLRAYASDSKFQFGAIWEREESQQTPALFIDKVVAALEGEQPHHVLRLEINLETTAAHRPAIIALEILDRTGTAIMQPMPTIEGFITDDCTKHTVRLAVDLPPLIPGEYMVTAWVGPHNTETYDEVKECVGFDIKQSPTKNRTYPHTHHHGYIVPHTTWEYSKR